MMKYKKVYVEITNACNLSCPFCAKSKRKKEFITIDNFKIILDKIKSYTDYLYFHILGEPLLHPKINELINLASKQFNINITTNGFLIRNIENNKNIRQLNISLHSFNESYGISLSEYLDNIFSVTDKLREYTFISYRLWVSSKYNKDIIDAINKKYATSLDYKNIKNNRTLAKNIFISTHDEFTWPADSNKSCESGTCYALKDHIGILVNGTVVPCCLDSEGKVNLGNIYKDDLSTIINSPKCKGMLNGFKENKRIEELCKHCNFK